MVAQRSGGGGETPDGQKTGDVLSHQAGTGRIDASNVGHLQQSGHLVMGPGARRDTSGGKYLNFQTYG